MRNCRIASSEWQTFDVADGTTYFDEDNVDAVIDIEYPSFYLVRYVGDNLDCSTQIFAPALLRDNRIVDLTGGEIASFRHGRIGKPLIVAEVKIRFGAVFGHKDLAMLKWVHRTGVDVNIRVELLEHDIETS